MGTGLAAADGLVGGGGNCEDDPDSAGTCASASCSPDPVSGDAATDAAVVATSVTATAESSNDPPLVSLDLLCKMVPVSRHVVAGALADIVVQLGRTTTSIG